jgi:hypothetical protein
VQLPRAERLTSAFAFRPGSKIGVSRVTPGAACVRGLTGMPPPVRMLAFLDEQGNLPCSRDAT